MKKLFAFLTSLVCISAMFGCEESAPESVPESVSEPAVSEPVEDEPVNRPHITGEFKAEDFKEITVRLTKQEYEVPPVEYTEYDWSWVDFGAKLSPCKSEEYRDRYSDDYIPDFSWCRNEEELKNAQEVYYASVEEKLNTPYEGQITSAVYGDGCLYFMVNYDDLCYYDYSHCLDIIKCDLETKKQEVIYSVNDPENVSKVFDRIQYANGSLWVMVSEYAFTDDSANKHFRHGNDYLGTKIYKLCDDGTLIATDAPDDLDAPWFTEASADRLLVYTAEYNDDYSRVRMYSLDTETLKYTQICEQIDKRNNFAQIYDDTYLVQEENDDNEVYVYNDELCINTGMKQLCLRGAHNNRIIFTRSSGSKTMLYTYDLEKMERYDIDISGFGSIAYFVGDNLMIANGGNMMFTYIVPDLGVAFLLHSFKHMADISYGGGDMYIFGNSYNSAEYDYTGKVIDRGDDEKKIYVYPMDNEFKPNK